VSPVRWPVPAYPPEPGWLRAGAKPPWFSSETWNSLHPHERQEILDGARAQGQAYYSQLQPPQWLVRGERPPHVPEETWAHLPWADKQQIVTEARDAFARYVDEQMSIFYNGAPSSGRPTMNPLLGVSSFFGRGVVGPWAFFRAEGAKAAQFLNLDKMLGSIFPNMHTRLCGPLAAAAVLGLDIRTCLELFRSVDESKLTESANASNQDLMALFSKAGWKQPPPQWMKDGLAGFEATPEWLQGQLAQGNGLVALVNIDEGQRGMLRAKGSEGPEDTAHWVAILDVSQTPSGDAIVRVYNPYHNREEVYPWSTFEAAWAETKGNESEHGVLVATPPPDPPTGS
jgi:hypothetical protein